jgi:hypothetical protein
MRHRRVTMHADDLAGLARGSRLAVRLCIATAVFPALLFITVTSGESTVFDRTPSVFLSYPPYQCGADVNDCPKTLTLSPPPAGNAPAMAETSSLMRGGGNQWQQVGGSASPDPTWRMLGYDLLSGAFPSVFQFNRRVLTAIPTSADLALGLLNANDLAAKFDIRVDVLFEAGVAGDGSFHTGLSRCISLSATSARVKHLTPQGDEPYVGGGALCCGTVDVSVFVRMGTNEDDSSCGGSDTASGVRLFYGSPEVPSAVTLRTHEEPETEPTFFVPTPPFGVTPVPESSLATCYVSPEFGSCPLASTQLHDDTHYFESGPLVSGPGWTTLGRWTDENFEVGIAPIVGLSDRELFLGLKRTADVGARFDILAVVRIVSADDTAVFSFGLVRCVRGLAVASVLGERGRQVLRNASRVAVPFLPFQTSL